MARTKNPTQNDKGKNVSDASSAARKRARTTKIHEGADPEYIAEVEEEETMEVDEDPSDWEHGEPLSKMPGELQPQLYREKLKKVDNIRNILGVERAVKVEEFSVFGINTCFERLGWEAALTFNGDDKTEVYADTIVTWMSTLRKELGNNPPRTIKLIGMVGKKEVELSFEKLGNIAKFDSGPKGERRTYEYLPEAQILCDGKKGPEWNQMKAELFVVPKGKTLDTMPLIRGNLKPLPKLLALICNTNVIPRSGDKGKIRRYEIKVLYALVTGRPALSLKQIIMMNIWESHESKERLRIPHCRLLSKFFTQEKVIKKTTPFENMPSQQLTISRLAKNDWAVRKLPKVWRLVDLKSGRVIEVDRDDPEEEDETETVEAAKGAGIPARIAQQGPQRYSRYNPKPVDPELYFTLRPSGFSMWTPAERAIYDQNSIENIRMQWWREDESRLNREARISAAYAHELDRNNRFHYEEDRRYLYDYDACLSYTEVAPLVNWQQAFEADGRPRLHHPQSHASSWIPFQVPVEGSSSQAGASDSRAIYERSMTDWFGHGPNPYPPHGPSYGSH